MGSYLARAGRKRARDADLSATSAAAGDDDDGSSGGTDTPPSSALSRLLLGLRYRGAAPCRVGSAVCRCVAEDDATRRAYGCHAHVYETESAEESHGVALVWCLDGAAAAPLSALSLLSLCRVANSCRKMTLLTAVTGQAVVLTYTAAL
ncbi:hypothetical protein NESM_000465500 [Novymonas esmeraldas]|uniref:tRNA-intron lyase n=1 Tax=Novymonas esmeraldas TaxID=1808958 RepID=A0AAW0EQ97_9TRYP